MEDTDWRPSRCPGCGKMRNAERYPVCTNTECDLYALTGPESKKARTMKTEKHYVWSKLGHALVMVDDLEWLFKNPEFDSKADKIYELGPEIKIEMVVKVIPTKPITRGHEGANNYGSY
jgi:hypothetical protein